MPLGNSKADKYSNATYEIWNLKRIYFKYIYKKTFNLTFIKTYFKHKKLTNNNYIHTHWAYKKRDTMHEQHHKTGNSTNSPELPI